MKGLWNPRRRRSRNRGSFPAAGRTALGLLAVTAGIFLLAASAGADIYWESIQIVRQKDGKESSKKTIRTYLTPTFCRMDIGDNIMIADFDRMTGYVLNTEDKIFMEIKMASVGKIPDGLKADIQVTPTNETRTINGYLCKKFKVTFIDHQYEEWLSKEVDGYEELKNLNGQLTKVMNENPLFQMGIVGRMDRLDGFPVQTVTPVDAQTTRIVTLKKVSKDPIDASVFSIPKGYRPSYE